MKKQKAVVFLFFAMIGVLPLSFAGGKSTSANIRAINSEWKDFVKKQNQISSANEKRIAASSASQKDKLIQTLDNRIQILSQRVDYLNGLKVKAQNLK